jgi:hypothetical protein
VNTCLLKRAVFLGIMLDQFDYVLDFFISVKS